MHNLILGLMANVFACALITNMIKITVGVDLPCPGLNALLHIAHVLLRLRSVKLCAKFAAVCNLDSST